MAAIKGEEAIARLHPQFLVDGLKNPTAVMLPIDEWNQLLEYLEDLEDIRACVEEEKCTSEPISFGVAVEEIRAEWQK